MEAKRSQRVRVVKWLEGMLLAKVGHLGALCVASPGGAPLDTCKVNPAHPPTFSCLFTLHITGSNAHNPVTLCASVLVLHCVGPEEPGCPINCTPNKQPLGVDTQSTRKAQTTRTEVCAAARTSRSGLNDATACIESKPGTHGSLLSTLWHH
ncbi:unnamed protein product [Pleuronectes platessa]|uniref:Uncharacterized protein n=1 Tax=Pleuronectes platessa TaxID=8262 RepID=A0A9N7Z2D7_PLEPL|nr:unnamed protein product [Pleuronectes platessa]